MDFSNWLPGLNGTSQPQTGGSMATTTTTTPSIAQNLLGVNKEQIETAKTLITVLSVAFISIPVLLLLLVIVHIFKK